MQEIAPLEASSRVPEICAISPASAQILRKDRQLAEEGEPPSLVVQVSLTRCDQGLV